MGRIDRGFSSGVAHTPTFEALRRAFRIAAYSGRPDAPPADELIEMHREAIVSRRAFLKGTAATALVVGAGGLLTACRKELDSPGADAPRIVVVGGGIAGLNTAYRLKEQGVRATIYEGSSRTGGRIFTARDIMGPGLTTELGAEFIDSHHAEMLRLVSELGLTLLDTRAPGEAALASEVFYLEGRRFTERQVIEEFRAPARVVASHYAAAPMSSTTGRERPFSRSTGCRYGSISTVSASPAGCASSSTWRTKRSTASRPIASPP